MKIKLDISLTWPKTIVFGDRCFQVVYSYGAYGERKTKLMSASNMLTGCMRSRRCLRRKREKNFDDLPKSSDLPLFYRRVEDFHKWAANKKIGILDCNPWWSSTLKCGYTNNLLVAQAPIEVLSELDPLKASVQNCYIPGICHSLRRHYSPVVSNRWKSPGVSAQTFGERTRSNSHKWSTIKGSFDLVRSCVISSICWKIELSQN